MANQRSEAHQARIRELFSAHTDDLSSVCPQAHGVFVCPICLSVFLEELLDEYLQKDELDIGHVWPKRIRAHSDRASQQVVLLCKRCNSSAGGHGDASLQMMHVIGEGERTGELYGIRFLRVFPRMGDEPIELKARVSLERAATTDKPVASFAIDLKRNDPSQTQKWLELVSRREPIPIMMVHPPSVSGHKASLADIGLLTSAYLLSFYTLGYRYILRTCLDPVRDCIRGSFSGAMDTPTSQFGRDDLCILHFSTRCWANPTISLVIPLREGMPRHLFIAFRTYGIRLPVPPYCNESIAVVANPMEESQDDKREVFADLTNHRPHDGDCLLDAILGGTDCDILEDARPNAQ